MMRGAGHEGSRLSIDSNFGGSRMSMDSNTGYLMDGSGRLAQEHAGLAFDDTFKRMSLDAQFGGGLGAPLASVAERQELVRACPPPLSSL